MPVCRVAGTTHVALGNTNRAAICANSTRPRQASNEFLGEQQFAVGAIEDVEKTVPVRMQKQLSLLSAIRGVDEDIGLGRIPIANIVRRELVVPLQFSGGRIEREDTVGEQIVAAALAIIGIRPRIAGGPVERIGLGIVGTGLPGPAPARRDGRSLPGLKARIALRPEWSSGARRVRRWRLCRRKGIRECPSRRPRRRRSPCL